MSNENSSNYITINRGARRLRDSLRMGRHPRDKRRQKHSKVVTAFDVKGLSELTETFFVKLHNNQSGSEKTEGQFEDGAPSSR